MSRVLQPCGTVAARSRHIVNGEDICDLCRVAVNEYEERRRRRAGQQAHAPSECGTHSGYCRHIYLNEPTCTPCKAAHVAAVTVSQRKVRHRKRRGTIPTVIADYVETHGPMQLRELVMLIRLRHDIEEGSIRRAANRMMSNGSLIRGVDIVTGGDRAAALGRVPSVLDVPYAAQAEAGWVA